MTKEMSMCSTDLMKEIADSFEEIRKKKKSGYMICYTEYSDNTTSYFTLNKFKDYKNLFKRLIDIFSECEAGVDAILDLSKETFEMAQMNVDAINSYLTSEYEYYYERRGD